MVTAEASGAVGQEERLSPARSAWFPRPGSAPDLLQPQEPHVEELDDLVEFHLGELAGEEAPESRVDLSLRHGVGSVDGRSDDAAHVALHSLVPDGPVAACCPAFAEGDDLSEEPDGFG